MKKNMLIRVLAVICVLACLFAFVSCHDEINATIEQNKTDAETALNNAKAELNEAIAAVRATADAAAVKSDLNAAVARIEAAEGDLAATKAALETAKADLAAVKTIAESAAVKTEVDAAIAAIEAAIAECATQADLDAIAAKVDANTADIAEIQADIAELASKTEVAEVRTALEALISANTTDIATIKTTIATLASTEYVDGVKAELNASIKALETKLAADIKTNADAIATLKTDVANLKTLLEDIDLDDLVEKIALVEEMLKEIDIYGEFEKNYGALTDKLLDPDYEYAYVKFVEAVLDIDDGPYDPEDAKKVRLQAENILFEVTRATSEDGLKDLYEELAAIKASLKTLEESLTEKVGAITYINTSKECADAVNAANKLYERMIELAIEFENAELKTTFERIWNAYVELNGGVAKDGVAYDGFKNVATNEIDKAFAALLSRDVILGSNDKQTIANYQAAIVALKAAINNSAFRDLYEAGLADGVIDAVKAEVLAETIADYAVTKADAFKAECIAAYIGTETEGAWADAVVALIAADLKAANAQLSEEDALAQAAEAYAADASAYADKLATAYANAEAKANEQDFTAEIAAKVDAAANAYVESDEGDKAIFVRAMAESLYNEDGAEAIAVRYANMEKAAADAVALVNEVVTVIGNWKTTGLLWTDDTAINAFNSIAAWVANASYKSNNAGYIAAYEFVDDNITDANRDYVFGTYAGTITNYVQLENVVGYVVALNETYNYLAFETESYSVEGVAALINEIKKAVNGVDVDGVNVLDVDNIAVDHVKASIKVLEAQLKVDAANNAVAAKLNYEAMIPAVITDRIAVIENAEAKLAAIITEIKALYYKNNAWVVTDINAAPVIEAFEARIDAEYAIVKSNSIAPDYVIYNVTSSLAEDAINSAYAAFEKFTEYAGQKYKEAKALIDKLEALGAVKLDHGKEIYDVAVALQTIPVVIPGLTYQTRFPVKNDTTGEYEMVDFSILQDKMTNKYVPEYAALAASAEAKAAELTTAINDLVAAVGNNANKLDNYNAIMAMLARVNNEWLKAFYSADMQASKTDSATVINAVKAALTATADTKIIGGLGKTYSFLVNDTFAKLETITNTAVSTYNTVKGKAEAWIKDAVAIVNGGNYTFHDWDKSGKNFKNIEETYAQIVKDYYIITALAADTDPDFGLYEAHETFIVEYNKCKTAAAEAASKIAAIESAISALGEYSTITLTNTADRRVALNAIYALIADFEANYCGKAQTDGDIDADLLFDLAKYDAVVQVLEAWVAVEANWDPAWDVNSEYNTLIESADVAIQAAIDSGNFETVEAAINAFVSQKSTLVKTNQ